VLASCRCAPPEAIEREAPEPILVVITDRRFVVFRLGVMFGRNIKEVLIDLPLGDIAGVKTRKRHPVATMGVPVQDVALNLRRGETLFFSSRGFANPKTRAMVEVLRSVIDATPTVDRKSPPAVSDAPNDPWAPPQPDPVEWSRVGRRSGLAIWAFVLGLVWWGIGGVIAIVLGRKAIKRIDSGSGETGRGLAVAGIILGALSIIGVVLAVVLVAVLSH
jgi:hypothetical protein